MRTFVSYLVATTVALHSMLGCCWHHAHAHEGAATVAGGHEEYVAHGEHEHAAHEDASHEDGAHDKVALHAEPAADCGCRHACGFETPPADPASPSTEPGESDHLPPCPGSCDEKRGVVTAPRVQPDRDGGRLGPNAFAAIGPDCLAPRAWDAACTARDPATFPPHERLYLLERRLLI